jgi:hypothetical protein
MLSLELCYPCGDRVEKHLKRAIPKKLIRTLPAGSLSRPQAE